MKKFFTASVLFFCLIQNIFASVEEVVQHSMSKICKIKSIPEMEESMMMGTGFVLSDNGYIMTCYHVANSAKMRVTFENDDTEFVGDKLWSDSSMDIAIIKINPNKKLDYFAFSEKRIKLGQKIVVIGHPLGLGYTVSTGIISNLSRKDIDVGSYIVKDSIQLECGILPGDSGGPIIDMDSKVVGIVYAKHTKGEGIGFGVAHYFIQPAYKKVFDRMLWNKEILKPLSIKSGVKLFL